MRHSFFRGFLSAVLWVISLITILAARPACAADPPSVDYFYPCGASPGSEAQLTAGGTFATWPPEVWLSDAAIELEPAKEQGKFKLTVPEDAPPGVVLVRLFDAHGASSLRPLLISPTRSSLEQEPNNHPDEAQAIQLPRTVQARLQERGDVDVFAVDLKEGETLVAALLSSQVLAGPLDATLQICSTEGFVLAHEDDERGLDPQLLFQAPAAGTYLVRVFGFPVKPNSSVAFAGGEDYIYRLTLTAGPFVDFAVPSVVTAGQTSDVELRGHGLSEPPPVVRVNPRAGIPPVAWREDTVGMAVLRTTKLPVVRRSEEKGEQPLGLPVVVSGVIATPGQEHAFVFDGTKGQRVAIDARSNTLGYPLDPLLELYDKDGTKLQSVDDSNRTRDAQLVRTLPADGRYRLVLRDTHGFGGPGFLYQLAVENETADFALSVAEDAVIVPAGGEIEVTVSVARQNKFSEAIEIRAVDLPPGVECAAVTSEGKGATAKSVKLKLTAGSPGHGTFRILGTAAGDAPLERAAHYTLLGGLAARSDIWVTVAPNEEKK